MSAPPDRRTQPADLVALAMRVQQDERSSPGARLADARRLREALEQADDPPTTDASRLLWLIDQAEDPAIHQGSKQARSALVFVGLIVVGLGLLSGVGLASAVFYYDGDAPVNVVAALGVFVLLQGVLLLLTALAALPRGALAWLPGADGVQEALRLASPGRLALLGARFLPQDMREALAAALGRTGAHRRVYARVQLWAVLRWSQLYALALNAAAVLIFVYLFTFTDLAFGWSTTLGIEPADFHRFTHAVATPWGWHTSLTPSLELVERSRYFRGTPFVPEDRGAWWPFVLTAMLVYGLLPRVIAVVIASSLLSKATQRALLATPGASELLGRLRTSPGSDGDESVSSVDDNAAAQGELGARPAVIDWSGAAGSSARAAALLSIEPSAYAPAGGARTVADDRQTLDTITSSVGADGVALLVKLWEPPVIETTEFLRELRAAIGDALPVRVVPVASDASGRVIGDDPVLAEQWRRRVTAIGDPWTSVADTVGLTANDTEPGDG